MGFRNPTHQTFIITPFAADLPSGENLWPCYSTPSMLYLLCVSHLTLAFWKHWKQNTMEHWARISGVFQSNILSFACYVQDWQMSEKYTSQLFSSKNRSRVVKVDVCPKFYSSACSFSFPTFFPYFPPPFSHSSYLMGVVVLCCPLALWIINTPAPSCTVGQETPLMRTCTRCHYNEDHLSIKPVSERTCSKAYARR